MENLYDQNKKTAGYPSIPDHSDLRGFSYRAPTNFDYRDELKPRSLWRRLRDWLKLGLG
jgi:hypothetical protein